MSIARMSGGLWVLWAGLSVVFARDIHVGSDAPTMAAAIKLAQAGDAVHLAPKVYREYACFYAKQGELGRPITLDGHGVTIEKSDPLDSSKWTEVSPGLFATTKLLLHLDDAILMRWFFLQEGKMIHMGQTSKGKQAPFKKAEELLPGESTFVLDLARSVTPAKESFGPFYFQLSPGQKLGEAKILVSMRSAGVQLSGANAYLIMRNLTATHPYKDDFNIHGDRRDIVFENIRAVECGDDGISAHESAEYRVDGYIGLRKSTGITDTVAARTGYDYVFLADNFAFDFYFPNNGRYQVRNVEVLSSGEHCLNVSARAGECCELSLGNVLIRRVGAAVTGHIDLGSSLHASKLMMESATFRLSGDLRLTDYLIDGKVEPTTSTRAGADRKGLVAALVPSAYRKFSETL